MSTVAPTSGWSSTVTLAINPSGYIYTATPGTGGSILLQWSADNIEWVNFTGEPISIAMSGGVPAGANYLRGMGFGAAGTFDVTAGPAATQLSAAQLAALVGNTIIPTSAPYNAKCDGKAVYDGVVTGTAATQMTVSSATGGFTASDVGKASCTCQMAALNQISRFGTIVQVIDSNTVVCNLNGVTTGANQILVWGTDDTEAMQAVMLAAHNTKAAIIQPEGLCVITGQVMVPLTGVRWLGPNGPNTIRDVLGTPYSQFLFSGSCVVFCGGDPGTGGGVSQGSTAVSDTSNFGANITGIKFIGMNRCAQMVGYLTAGVGSTRNSHVRWCAIIMGSGWCYESTASGVLADCIVMSTNKGSAVVRANGDSKIHDNYIYGAPNGGYGVRASGNDIGVNFNHIFKDANQPTMLGGAVQAIFTSSQGTSALGGAGAVGIVGNVFDTNYGSAVDINLGAGAYARSVIVALNRLFNNNNVPAATYPFMTLTMGAGSELRGFSVTGNTAQSSFADTTKGTLTAFIDGSANSGTVRASGVVNNHLDGCAAGYISFTPSIGANLNTLLAPAALTTTVTF